MLSEKRLQIADTLYLQVMLADFTDTRFLITKEYQQERTLH